jgi:7,8-dihydropterin-6-yl-methyl-4-(beta-D-ribofuranosyl)aminobenzene 5'-phosphate synthase
MPEEEINRLVVNLKSKWNVQRIAPGHCTGEPAFAQLEKAFAEKYVYAGAGTKVI